uniref:Nematode cuticle collagen N-terminal domain-containing protein n=1 Tax=Ditylenchus dipsaci TaxID=166011 RepID=A0A915CVU1_9BILA
MKVHTATFLASSLSGLSLIACLFVIASIYSDVQNIWQELDMEIGSFRSTTDDMWRDMMRLGANKKRFRRQAEYENAGKAAGPSYEAGGPSGPAGPAGPGGPSGAAPGTPAGAAPPSVPPSLAGGSSKSGGPGCSCQIDNKCPAGPPGPKGINGRNGPEGKPESQDTQGCFNCPAGPQGPPGPIGRPGPRGHPGAKGQSGMPGRDGQPGHPGESGPPGPPGPLGQLGNQGEKGRDAEHPIGRPGPKGQRGAPGGPGPAGDSGKPAPAGQAGTPGPAGGPGPQGPLEPRDLKEKKVQLADLAKTPSTARARPEMEREVVMEELELVEPVVLVHTANTKWAAIVLLFIVDFFQYKKLQIRR